MEYINLETNQPLTFTEKERICESIFLQKGPFWHLYTDGTKMQNIFDTEEEFELGMNLLAVSCCRTKEMDLLAFEIMKNHLHLVLAGKKESCMMLFDNYKRRMKRIFRRRGHIIDWSRFNAQIIPIDNLKSLRNEIIYAHRNAFVSQAAYTPYNYPWGSGIAYFNPAFRQIQTTEFSRMTYDDRRSHAHIRDISGLESLRFQGSRVYIPSFCNVGLGESLFNDPRSYFSSLTRNAEAFSEIASRLKDSVFLTDDEIFAAASRYAEQEFNIKQLSILAPEQKIHLAKELHFRYNATNQQIRRLLKLDISLLNELFPN